MDYNTYQCKIKGVTDNMPCGYIPIQGAGTTDLNNINIIFTVKTAPSYNSLHIYIDHKNDSSATIGSIFENADLISDLMHTIKLSPENINRIKYLISHIENKNHFSEFKFPSESIDAELWINGKQIYYTSDFKLPHDMTKPYSENKYLNELIRYILNISPIDVKAELDRMIKE